MTLEEFRPIFREVALKFQFAKLQKGTLESYFDVLGNLDVRQITDGARQIARESKFFPTTSEWYQTASAIPPPIATMRSEGGTTHDADRWTFHECPAEPCDRTFKHLPHSYVRPKRIL